MPLHASTNAILVEPLREALGEPAFAGAWGAGRAMRDDPATSSRDRGIIAVSSRLWR